MKPKFLTRSKKINEPIIPRAFDLRKSELNIAKMARKETDRLKRTRLFEIRKDLVCLLRAM